MELLEGKTFRKLLSERGRISARELLEAVDPILEAMNGMHAKGIIHRDISPDNIMLLPDGTAKLLDFGCARETANGQTMTVMLKHGYAPIEQYTGHNQGVWTDIYALSATLYHCLTGKKPPSALDRNDKEPLPAPNELGAALTGTQEQGLMKGLAVKPEDRWQSISGLYDALYGPSTEDVSPSTLGNQKDIKKAKSSKLIAACAAVVILLGVMAAFAWGNFSKPSEVEPENNEKATQGSDESDDAKDTEPPVQGTWWSFEDNVLTIHGSGPMDNYPYDYRPWDDHHYDIEKIVIEDGVTDIGEYAFYKCVDINNVQIPTSVTAINAAAFADCKNLTEVVIPNGVSSIDDSAFSGCERLSEVIIPDSVKSIGFSAFSGCTVLQHITIPNSVASIGARAFAGTGLISVTIPDGITSISNSMFSYCDALSSVVIPDSVLAIGEYAFDRCSNLIDIAIPNSVKSIEKFAFYMCESLSDVTIPTSVTFIDEFAFRDCPNLEHAAVTLPPSCQYYQHSFPDRTATYGGIMIPQGVTGNCAWTIENGVLTIGGSSLTFDKNGAMADNESDIYVPWRGFRDSIKAVVIEDDVTHIGDYAFYDLFVDTITIPDSVTSIGRYAFYRSGIEQITIPDSITSIGEGAFSYCPLKDLVLPNSITAIEDWTFYRSGLVNITIPDSVTRIESGAFVQCEDLASVTIEGDCPYYSDFFPDTCKVTGGTLKK